MLRVAIICPDQEVGAALERALLDSRMAAVVLHLNRYPDAVELERLLTERTVEAVFLSYESPQRFSVVASFLEKKASGIPMVAVVSSCDPNILLELMRAGVREVLTWPFDPQKLREALGRIQKIVDSRTPTIDRLYSFLPAKPGVGATTVALNTAVALSRIPDTSVLLVDFDLNSGIIGFLLKLNPRYSVIDAVEHAEHLDQDVWAKLVWPMGTLDVLPTGRLDPGLRVDPARLQMVLAFARRFYKVICVDHSGMMEKYSLELLRESARIFMVATPEVPALHLGAEKLRFLRGLDLASRVEIILNRAQPRSLLSREQIEQMLGAAIRTSIPNDYAAVHQAIMAGQPLSEDSRLGQHFQNLARSLLELPAITVTKKRRFFEYFSLAHAQNSR
jgi:pilus assembly protein CpaE